MSSIILTDFFALVERELVTEGLIMAGNIPYVQEIYRKLIHLSSLWMSVAMYFFSRPLAAGIFLALLIGNVLVEYGHYCRWPVCHPLYKLFFGKMLRPSSRDGFKFSGSPFVLASAFLTVLLFSREIASFAFAVMLVGDSAAALVGRAWGKRQLCNGKSLEGVIAFVLGGLLVLLVLASPFDFTMKMCLKAVIGILLGAAAELFEKQLHLDDNFSIPLVIGGIMLI